MPVFDTDLRRVHALGDHSRERAVFHWHLPALLGHGILGVGLTLAREGFRFATDGWCYGQILCCRSGLGRVSVDGRWVECGANSAYLNPAGTPHAYEALPGRRWDLAWVIYRTPGPATPLADTRQATLLPARVRPLARAIGQLYRESLSAADPEHQAAWVELLRLEAFRVAGRDHRRHRLWQLWAAVDARPEHPWTLPELAAAACVSPAHLRRLCHQQLGRSPMEHVAYLRVRRAATLLLRTQLGLPAIAAAVGYGDRFALTEAFKRVTGTTPAHYRRTGGAAAGPGASEWAGEG